MGASLAISNYLAIDDPHHTVWAGTGWGQSVLLRRLYLASQSQETRRTQKRAKAVQSTAFGMHKGWERRKGSAAKRIALACSLLLVFLAIAERNGFFGRQIKTRLLSANLWDPQDDAHYQVDTRACRSPVSLMMVIAVSEMHFWRVSRSGAAMLVHDRM